MTDLTLQCRLADVERERDTLRAALLSRHGGEPLALLAALDAERARCAELEEGLEYALDWISRHPCDECSPDPDVTARALVTKKEDKNNE